jgi:hypothetical protein
MSVNFFPKEVRLMPGELYLLIQWDRMLWKLSEIIEEKLPVLQRLPVERLKVACTVWMGLVFGSARKEIIGKVKNLGYTESYAEKLVDKMIAKYKKLLGECVMFHIKATSETVKGQFGKPYSRRRKPGRPPVKYKLEELFKVKENKRIDDLTLLIMLLSGSLVRFLKLCVKMIKEPKMEEIMLGAFGKIFPVPHNEIRKSFEEFIIKEDLNKLIEDWYSKLMRLVWKDIPSILSLELPIKGNGEELAFTCH